MERNLEVSEPTRTWRSLRERNLQDQTAALQAGYPSVELMAIDELGRRLMALEDAVYGPLVSEEELEGEHVGDSD